MWDLSKCVPTAAESPQKGSPMTPVLVVDDHSFFRTCLVDLINASGDLEVVGECADGTEVAAAVPALRPEVVLMDVRMSKMSGLEAAATLQRQGNAPQVIMLSSDTAPSSQATARAHGAAGYLIKGKPPQLMLDAIRRVAAGGTAWPEDSESLADVSSRPSTWSSTSA
jgi:DNA-binding NarL/FixJ family response regulator